MGEPVARLHKSAVTSYLCTLLVRNLGNGYTQFGNLLQDCVDLLY